MIDLNREWLIWLLEVYLGAVALVVLILAILGWHRAHRDPDDDEA